mmetsp:Transcript_12888/g.20742  ORF Transcript_12888/g.20742 Transcript_12888/m.20742 type:complete len:84 (-) Transcript_12888:181-432(-)
MDRIDVVCHTIHAILQLAITIDARCQLCELWRTSVDQLLCRVLQPLQRIADVKDSNGDNAKENKMTAEYLREWLVTSHRYEVR